MENIRIKGLTAAVVTPMKSNGEINLQAIGPYAEFLAGRGVSGVFVCGTTGEGLLMDLDERKAVAEKWMEYSDKLNILVHVGSTSYAQSASLAGHAQEIGAKAISAMGPCFLQPSRPEELVAFNKLIADAAPDTPYYYYNIPGTSGCRVNMAGFMELACREIPTFNGIKYTDYNTCEMQECINFAGGRYDILHGHDETLIAGLQIGATGGIGTSYNVTSPMFTKLLEAWNAGDYDRAVTLQHDANRVVTLMCKYVNCIVGVKAMLELMGIHCGPCRLPLRNLNNEELKSLEAEFAQYRELL